MIWIIIYLSGVFITLFYVLYFVIKNGYDLKVADLIITIITGSLSYFGLFSFIIAMTDINIFDIVIYKNKNKK